MSIDRDDDEKSIRNVSVPASVIANHEARVEMHEIEELNRLRQVSLKRLDSAKFGWFQVRACFVSGAGFFTDAYDLFAINLVAEMLGYVYEKDGILPDNIEIGLKISAAIGTFVGQLVFGILADIVGRKKMYGVELWLIIFATLCTSLSGGGPYLNIYGMIIFWRVIVGLGVGGDYPLSAIITSEFAATKYRGAMMATVFAMQGFGILASIIVAVITLAAAKNDIYEHKNIDGIDYVWRIVLGLGTVPGIIALYFRLTIPETPRYRMEVEQDIREAENDINDVLEHGRYTRGPRNEVIRRTELPPNWWKDLRLYLSVRKNAMILLGTCGAWFCIDVAYYGIGLNNKIFIQRALKYKSLPGFEKIRESDAWTPLFHDAVGNLVITCLGTIPGYWCSVLFIDRWGRKPIQFMGFAALTVIFIVFGATFHKIKDTSIFLFGAIFILAQFFSNFGPNTTTFVVPGEVFPTRYRSTCYGISAAVGKLGAILAQVAFHKMKNIGGKENDGAEYTEEAEFVDKLLFGCAVFMLFGFFFTFLIPETKRRTLEELSNDNTSNVQT
ncbi:4453_t:CDS:2 [Ambispora gerdemannii]|uniref:4453_t:CDS:1 n=1 Tax=Ambispora gerdemannii TaxID=144530 RepID=A0A9N8VQS5_9GLOM|nr:4453_t:CDS:2 [Ambispora gerdemannii]